MDIAAIEELVEKVKNRLLLSLFFCYNKLGDDMNNILKTIFSLIIIAIIYQLIITVFISKHKANYIIKENDNVYKIIEKYDRQSSNNNYYFLITDKENNKFTFSYNLEKNEQSKIIKNIVTYKNNNLYCISPILKNNEVEDFTCILNNQLITSSYLKQIDNNSFNDIVSSLNNYKFNTNLTNLNDAKTIKDNVAIYNNINSNTYFTLWNYKGLYILNNKKITETKLLNNDSYFNEDKGILTGKYYISIDTDNDNNDFYTVYLLDGGKSLIESDYDISRNTYFNGTYKNKAYFTDIDNKVQYIIDPYSEKITKITDTSKCKYFDGESLKDVDISILTSSKKYFNYQTIPKKLLDKYSDKSLYYSLGNYYYLDSDGSFYKIVSNNYDLKVKLFKLDDFKEIKVLNGNIYGVSGNTIYIYNDRIGLQKAVEDRELNYNYKNIYSVYEN